MPLEADNDIINTFANDFTQRSYDSFIVAKWGYTPCHNREQNKNKKHCFLKIYCVFLARYKYNFLFYLLLRQDIKFTKHTTWCDI